MKNISILILIAILLAFSLKSNLFAAVPMVKCYLNDGNTKQYNISEIENLSFIVSNLSYSMSIFPKGNSLKRDIDLRKINSIKFENTNIMSINLADDTIEYNLNEIDSIIFIFNSCTELKIGDQVWTCKNLDVDHYKNGDTIPEVRDSVQWTKLTTGAWCYYNNDPAMGAICGKLYNWYAVTDPRGLAPEGWHIASDKEWTTLTICLGGDTIAGGKLKELDTAHWNSPNLGATNESGFSALPGGSRYGSNGAFKYTGYIGYFWSASDYSTLCAWHRFLSHNSTFIYRYSVNNACGLSVRCIRDK